MTPEFDRDKCAAAVVGLLTQMRAEWLKKNPKLESKCRVPRWSDLSSSDQALLIRSMHMAFVATTPDKIQSLKINGVI